MKKLSPESIAPTVRAWFGKQIERIAVRHDVAGPQVSRVRRGKYTKELVKELKSRALAASKGGEIVVSAGDLDPFCEQAARELIRIREIRAAHKAGKLATEAMFQLPAYAAFQDYFDEAPALVIGQLMAAVRDSERSNTEKVDSRALAQPSHPGYPVSPQTRTWMELHALGLALAEDAGGPPFGSVPRDDYITDSALRIREKARHAIRIGDLNVPAEDVDKVCWIVACEAYLLRSLGAAKQAGELTNQEIMKMPIYGPYKSYFDIGSDLVTMATSIAAAVGQPIQRPGVQN